MVDISIFYLMPIFLGNAILVMAICLVLATMFLEIAMYWVKLESDILASIPDKISDLLVRQQLMTI